MRKPPEVVQSIAGPAWRHLRRPSSEISLTTHSLVALLLLTAVGLSACATTRGMHASLAETPLIKWTTWLFEVDCQDRPALRRDSGIVHSRDGIRCPAASAPAAISSAKARQIEHVLTDRMREVAVLFRIATVPSIKLTDEGYQVSSLCIASDTKELQFSIDTIRALITFSWQAAIEEKGNVFPRPWFADPLVWSMYYSTAIAAGNKWPSPVEHELGAFPRDAQEANMQLEFLLDFVLFHEGVHLKRCVFGADEEVLADAVAIELVTWKRVNFYREHPETSWFPEYQDSLEDIFYGKTPSRPLTVKESATLTARYGKRVLDLVLAMYKEGILPQDEPRALPLALRRERLQSTLHRISLGTPPEEIFEMLPASRRPRSQSQGHP